MVSTECVFVYNPRFTEKSKFHNALPGSPMPAGTV